MFPGTREWSIMFCIVSVPLIYIYIFIILWHITVMSYGNVFGFVFDVRYYVLYYIVPGHF